MKEAPAPLSYKIALFCAVCMVSVLWVASHNARTLWPGVPPVPQKASISLSSLGDEQIAYRLSSLMLQNLGDTGGRVTSLQNYNYERIGGWMHLLHGLDQQSDFVPMIAAYYFGATNTSEDLKHIVDFLEIAGNDSRAEKWRWLVQAVFLARFRMDDLDRGLELAYKLSSLSSYNSQMPIWTRQMPAFVLAAKGEKEAAKELMRVILGTTKNLHPNEINFMEAYLNDDL